MTVRVTTLKGVGAGRYYTEHLPSYYLDGDEPPGRWWGRGADRLGLSGETVPEAFLAVMEGRDPATGRVLGRRLGEGSVRGYDTTFSAPKSVSVLFALGDEHVRRQVVDAHDRAVEAVLGWVEDHAHTRLRRRGHVVCVDAGGIIVGVFRQHTSRKLDPQLHTHAVIANRVPAPDGRWLALDARTIKMDQRTLSALYHAALRAELTRRLGVAWETPEHGIAEVAGVDPDVLTEFSQRTRDLERRVGEKLDRFRTELGREPSRKERWRLEREAVVDSRPAKPHGTSPAELLRWWHQRVEAMGHDPQRLVDTVIGCCLRLEGIDRAAAARMVDQALEALAGRQSTWWPAELVRELAAATPTTVTVDAGELVGFLEELAGHVTAVRCVELSAPVPAGATVRRVGRPISEAATDRALTTQTILDEEVELVAWAERRRDNRSRTPARVVASYPELTPAQGEAAAVVAGHGGLELIVGPAGAGKTTMLAAAVTSLQMQGRPVFGVAPTAVAADVLAVETGMPADTLDKLLIEWHHPTRPPDPAFQLPAGTTVIVDEAGTAPTPKLADLARLANQQGWRVVLVGDPRQFSAVGRGGMFAHLVDTHGAVELDQVHRFRHEWERRASLRLRAGDPTVLSDYDRHSRLHSGTVEQMEADIIDHWQEARRRGETVALMANRADAVAR
ncbi:MAG TPA: conjugative relaxase, partial [Acidobacteria bacterium]|nr:conjugative relaxase [Acidobacteriota bacterium]